MIQSLVMLSIDCFWKNYVVIFGMECTWLHTYDIVNIFVFGQVRKIHMESRSKIFKKFQTSIFAQPFLFTCKGHFACKINHKFIQHDDKCFVLIVQGFTYGGKNSLEW